MPRFLVAKCPKCSAQIEVMRVPHSKPLTVHPTMMYEEECKGCGEVFSGFVSDLTDLTLPHEPKRPPRN